MRKYLLVVLLSLIGNVVIGQNLQLRSNLTYNYTLANIGGYVDSVGNEYALVGTYQGLSIVDVTNPSSPFIRFSVPGTLNDWREVKTYRKFAYVTTEGGSNGLQIIDLSHLPDTIYYKQYKGDAAINNQLNTIHALHCDTATAYLYLYGSNLFSGASLFISLADPWNPHYVGNYIYPGSGSDSYVHDGYACNDTLYEGHIYPGFFTVVDVRNKLNPVLLATQETPTRFTHNTWLSDNHKTLFTTDENSGSFLGAYDISDLSNIQELSRSQTSPGSGVIIHNTHILNDFAITSWYKDGVVITDVSRPANPVAVGKYDTYPQGSGNGFNGCWGVYPFLPSGTIVASDIDNGLFVLSPTYIRGCYLEGITTDTSTGAFINGTLVELLTSPITKLSDPLGAYRMGTVTPGTYDVRFSKAGYYSKTINGVTLTNGVLTTLDVQLVPLQTFTYTGLVIDSLTGDPVADATVIFVTNGLSYRATSNAGGNFSISGVVPDVYTIYAGKWGYRTSCSSLNLTPGTMPMPIIAQGYYDDFTFDNGWTVSGTSANAWIRCEPIGTYDGNNTEINPENDVADDCSDSCFVTDNGGAPYNSSDVDNGNTILTSPFFDATIYTNPVLNYYRRYLNINGVGTPNDTMKVHISNGITTVTVENIPPTAVGNGTWVHHSVVISSLLTPTANMQLTIEVADNAPGNISEGAIDKFELTGALINRLPDVVNPIINLSIYPNPFQSEVLISYKLANYSSLANLTLTDLSGRLIETIELSSSEGTVKTGQQLSAGIYFVNLKSGSFSRSFKVIKY